MARQSYRDPWVKKAKWLTQALIVSGTLNVGLLSTFIYFALNENSGPIHFKEAKPEGFVATAGERVGIQELLTKYSALSFQDLLIRLGNNEHIESGYTRRDLALACLSGFHHFNLERALGGLSLQKRDITFTHTASGEKITLTVFPGLADYQYQAIVSYAKTEKWPFTSEGLFFEIKKSKQLPDTTLLEAFYLTPEFHFFSMLFSKTGVHLRKEHIIAVLAEGEWNFIHSAAQQLKQSSNFTVEMRRLFLLTLIKGKSRLAAKVLLETDQEYCLKQLDNDEVLFLCEILGDRTTPSFLKHLLESPRSDVIWKKASALLYELAAEEVPQELDLQKVKRRFIDLKETERVVPTPSKKKSRSYTVVSGDSLWKIAHNHGTTVQALRVANQLPSDTLRVGQTLILPNK
ncbi:MAG: Peptidoglycan endopeptidase LytF [Chlamydiae bacterium]|nr:Peptidoglycan endopeptidase LytF [Chlamydiota bacterium]